jgi:hypothetical protein
MSNAVAARRTRKSYNWNEVSSLVIDTLDKAGPEGLNRDELADAFGTDRDSAYRMVHGTRYRWDENNLKVIIVQNVKGDRRYTLVTAGSTDANDYTNMRARDAGSRFQVVTDNTKGLRAALLTSEAKALAGSSERIEAAIAELAAALAEAETVEDVNADDVEDADVED